METVCHGFPNDCCTDERPCEEIAGDCDRDSHCV